MKRGITNHFYVNHTGKIHSFQHTNTFATILNYEYNSILDSRLHPPGDTVVGTVPKYSEMEEDYKKTTGILKILSWSCDRQDDIWIQTFSTSFQTISVSFLIFRVSFLTVIADLFLVSICVRFMCDLCESSAWFLYVFCLFLLLFWLFLWLLHHRKNMILISISQSTM